MGRQDAATDYEVRPVLGEAFSESPPDASRLDMGTSEVEDRQHIHSVFPTSFEQEVAEATEEMDDVLLSHQAGYILTEKDQDIGSERVGHGGSRGQLD
jgi:hypothetical protein